MARDPSPTRGAGGLSMESDASDQEPEECIFDVLALRLMLEGAPESEIKRVAKEARRHIERELDRYG